MIVNAVKPHKMIKAADQITTRELCRKSGDDDMCALTLSGQPN